MISMQWPQNLRTLPQPLRKCFCLHYFAAKFMIWNWKLIWRSKKDQKVKFCNYDFYESLLWLYQITYLVPTYLVLAQFKKQYICIFSTTKPSLLYVIHIERATNQSKQKALPRTETPVCTEAAWGCYRFAATAAVFWREAEGYCSWKTTSVDQCLASECLSQQKWN